MFSNKGSMRCYTIHINSNLTKYRW